MPVILKNADGTLVEVESPLEKIRREALPKLQDAAQRRMARRDEKKRRAYYHAKPPWEYGCLAVGVDLAAREEVKGQFMLRQNIPAVRFNRSGDQLLRYGGWPSPFNLSSWVITPGTIMVRDPRGQWGRRDDGRVERKLRWEHVICFEEQDGENLLRPARIDAMPVAWRAAMLFSGRFRSYYWYTYGVRMPDFKGQPCEHHACRLRARRVGLLNEWGTVIPQLYCEAHYPGDYGGRYMAD